MSVALTGTALTAARNLTLGYEDDHQMIVYLGGVRGVLDESAITTTWLPGVGWEDRTTDVLLSEGVDIDVTELGATITLSLAEESRQEWAADRALAIVARHWFPGAGWGGYYVAAWGFLTGEGSTRYEAATGQTGRRTATYAGYWQRLRLPGHRLGRRNLAAGASIHAASPELTTPLAEAGIEYVSQDSCAPEKLIDQLGDTVAVADVFADPAIPTIGQTQLPKFLRVGGSHTRGVAAGGQARFAELWAGHDILGWSSFPAPEGNSSTAIDNDLLQAYTTSDRYVVRCKAQPGNQNNSVYVQWNIGSAYHGLAALFDFRIKAGATDSIGRNMVLQWGHSGTNHNVPIRLSGDWQQFEVDIDALGGDGAGSLAGGTVLRFRADRDELVQNDLYFEIEAFPKLWLGWDSGWYSKREGKSLFLALDDGAGNERLVRLTNLNGGDNLNGGGDIVIPPRGSIIVADDRATFEQQFGNTGQTILQMKGEYPEWFFAPGVGKMKLVYGNDPVRTDYDDASLTGGVLENGTPVAIEEIDFAVANGGVPWLPSQSLSRQSPVGTGFLAVEEFAHLGLIPPFGAAYWWIDLGAFVAPLLTGDISDTSDRLPVDDIDQYTAQGYCTIGTERVWWSGKDGDSLVVHQRGFGGTTATDHSAGDAVVPDGYNGSFQAIGTRQTGHNVDQIEIRRKPGTPLILAGAVLTSNLVAPGDPSTGGATWERHPDWTLVQRFTDRQGNPDVITMNLIDILGGPREVRHVCLVIDRMARVNGIAQRAKANEVVVREWRAAGDVAGGWTGHAVADLGGALAHVLTQHAGVPASKVRVAGRMPPIGDLTVAPSMVSQALSSLGGNDGVRVRLDRANGAIIEPTPVNPAYTATVPYWTWTSDLTVGPLAGGWQPPRRVAQARVASKDAASLRSYSTAYPKTAGQLGEIRELRDVRVLTAADGFARAVREYRAGNVRRTPLTLDAGALPWISCGQRHLIDLPLDPEGGFTSINTVVDSYSISIGIDPGGVTFTTSVRLSELALG